MIKHVRQILLLFLLLVTLHSNGQLHKTSTLTKNSLYAGAAKINITPTVAIPMSGYGGRDNPFTGVHDDLFARAIAFSDGTNKALLIATDLIGISNAIWQETTNRITRETGIKKEYIMLSAVHNHNGPVINVYEKNKSAEVADYIETLMNKILTVSKDALSKMVPVNIGAGKGECKMNINRRVPDGSGEISLGLNPYAPCDHEVGVIKIADKQGSDLAVMMNWPCHGVVLGPNNYLITGDWPGAASRYIEDSSKGKTVAPVFIGASGDINPLYGPHIDFEKNSSYAYGKEAIAEDLGRETFRVMKNIKTFSSGRITGMQRLIWLPAKPKDNENYQRPETQKEDSVSVLLSVLKIGNIVFTAVSGEVFNQISVKMRKRSPYPFTFMITHCNGSSGYLVTDDAYTKPGVKESENKYVPTGGYEVGSTSVRSGAEKGIIENLLAMIKKL